MELRQDGPAPPAEEPFFAQLSHRLRAVLGFELSDAVPIVTGYANNNRLWRLHAADGRQAVAKRYYQDDRRRLEREFGTLTFLHKRGMARIPTPLLRCDDLEAAIYSNESGVTVPATDLTVSALVELGRFVADLHAIKPGDAGAAFPAAVAASFSNAEKVAAIRERLRLFAEAAAAADAPGPVRALCAECDVVGVLERLLAGVVAGLDDDTLGTALAVPERRLDTGDFAPHNVLIHSDGSVCVLDFEYAGWDQPLASLAGFLTAATALDLGREQTAAFLQTYRDGAGIPDVAFAVFPRLCALSHLFWCGVHLSITTPAHLARKRFANPELDANAVIADQIAYFKRRLAIGEAAVAALA